MFDKLYANRKDLMCQLCVKYSDDRIINLLFIVSFTSKVYTGIGYTLQAEFNWAGGICFHHCSEYADNAWHNGHAE